MKRENRWLPAAIAGAALTTLLAVSPVRAIPPDPDNAALLYYQAFLSLPDLDDEARDHLVGVAKGTIAPNDKTRQYVGCRGAIGLADAARSLCVCQWGVQYSKGFQALLPHLSQMRFLSYVLLADARMLALDGHHKEALERCLGVKKLARHVGDELVISLLVRHAIDALADDGIRDILGMMPPDAQTLEWLKGQLATTSIEQASVIKGLKVEHEIFLDTMRMDKLPELMEAVQSGVDLRLPEKIDEAVLAANREYYGRFMTSMQATVASPMSYSEKWSALQAMFSQLTQDAEKGTAATLTAALVPALGKVYGIDVKAQARANALRVGLDLLTAKAQTGTLPDRLPANKLQDPFSGRDYLYERTSGGFVLRCQGKDLDKDQVYEWEFKVK